jgi:predicted lipoprotein with Yx(FWY)xxD motif
MRSSAAGCVCLLAMLAVSCGSPDEIPPGATLSVDASDELGRFVTDHGGRAVYARLGDDPCVGPCASAWPPVPGSEAPIAPSEPAIQQELVGSILRDDGWRQLTYATHPLHYRGPSERPGAPERAVTDEYGTWSLVFPHGELMAPQP